MMIRSLLFTALGFFATCCSAEYRLVDPTFFLAGGAIANSYDPSSNEFDPPLQYLYQGEDIERLSDMAFVVGNDNPYILASASNNFIDLYSIFTGYENAYQNIVPKGYEFKPRLFYTVSPSSVFALSHGGVTSYLAYTGDDGIVRIRRNNHDADALGQGFSILEDDSIKIPGGATAIAFEPSVKNTNVYLKLAFGRADGTVEVYQNTNYLDFPMTNMNKVAELSVTSNVGLPVEKIGFSNSESVPQPFWMAVAYALPNNRSGLKLFEENNYVTPTTEHYFEVSIRDFVFSNDNSKLAVLLSNGNIVVYGQSRNNFDTLITTIATADATACAFHANGELFYIGTSQPARIKTYSTRTWREVQDPVSLDFGDSIHKMIFRPVRSELESNYGITALFYEQENVVHELAVLTSKDDGTVPDLIAVYRVESPTRAPTETPIETAAPTAASSGAMMKSIQIGWRALVAFVVLGYSMV